MSAVADIQGSTTINLEATQIMKDALAKLYSHTEILKNEMNVFRV